MTMLAYLDALLAALASRDLQEIDRLLAHPLARILSADALGDAKAERSAAAAGTGSVAPLRLLQLRHRTAQLLGEAALADAPEPAERADSASRRPSAKAPAWSERRSAERRPSERHQMELPLSA
jgi:hypothetical protein